MNKYISRVLSDSAIHVENLIEQNEDAQCVILGDVYLLCDQLEAKDKRIAELQEALANIRAYSGVCSRGGSSISEVYNFANRALSNNKGEG